MNVYNLAKVPTLEVLALQGLRWLHSHGRKGGSMQGVLPSGNLSCSPEPLSLLQTDGKSHSTRTDQQTWNISLDKLSMANRDPGMDKNSQSMEILLPLLPFLGSDGSEFIPPTTLSIYHLWFDA